MDVADIAQLDAKATLAAAEPTVRARRAVDLQHARLLLHWCDLHAEDPQAKPGAFPVRYGGDKLVDIGGEGTPMVAELSLGEFAIAHRMGEAATRISPPTCSTCATACRCSSPRSATWPWSCGWPAGSPGCPGGSPRNRPGWWTPP